MIPATLGHYRIVRPIGAGGMGEVFLAEDEKLGRRVALKVMAHALAADPDRRARFEREARAVAALNHPNIITIYSVEEQGGVLFLTMELVEGKRLDESIPPQGMSLEQLLHLTIPLADAVGAAHQRGITHRDLKPANVMVTDEGRVKVLDFGLAKWSEASSAVDGLSAAMTEHQLTGEGRIVGTVAYMSPEQAQGKTVDARSDVFSLGILLFEMATGDRPFKGDTNVSVMSAILKDTPASVTDLRQDLPRDVGRILRRCLAKDPDDRYQTAKDLRNDLRLLKEDLDTGVAMRAQPSSHISQAAVVAPPVPFLARSPARLALVAVAVLAVAAGVWYARRPATAGAPAFASVTMRRLTNTGTARIAAISPDGRYVVLEDGNPGKPSLWMRQVSTASSVQIVPPMEGGYWGVAFSPDSEAVFYVFNPKNTQEASLFRIPVLGGRPRKVLEEIDTAPAFSPDGTRMAFIRPTDKGGSIMLASADGTNQRLLASRVYPDAYLHARVAWSPDGTLIAAFAGFIPWQRSRVVLVNVETGKEQEFSDARFDYGGQLVWLGDPGALVFDAVEDAGGRWNQKRDLWSLAYPGGTLRRITTDVASYQSVTATAGGRTLLAVRDEMRAGLWVVPDGDSSRARPITGTDGLDGSGGIDWTRDGRIVYSGNSQGSLDIWIANADGSQPKQLTSDPGMEAGPRLRSDGTGINYQSRASGAADVEVWSMELDGGNPRKIDTGGGIFRGYQETIGEHIYFKALVKGRAVAYRVPMAGGPRTPLFADPSRLPPRFDLRSVSPDERWALGRYVAPSITGIAVVPLDGAGPVRTFPHSHPPMSGMGCTWAPDGRAFEDLVLRDGTSNLWRFPLDGSPPRAVTTFTSEQILGYRWSRDGKTLAMSRGTHSADVVLIASDDKKE
jgi:Tol biopolymer transport system component